MSTIKKEGFSTGLGYVGSVPFSEHADQSTHAESSTEATKATKATNDGEGQNIYETYGNFSTEWKSASLYPQVEKGVYLVKALVNNSFTYAIIDYEGSNGSTYAAFLGVEMLSADNAHYFRAAIKDGAISLQAFQAASGESAVYYDSRDAIFYKKITQ